MRDESNAVLARLVVRLVRVVRVAVEACTVGIKKSEALRDGRLATAGVSLFLFLAIVCKIARVAASSDAVVDCFDTRVVQASARVSC